MLLLKNIYYSPKILANYQDYVKVDISILHCAQLGNKTVLQCANDVHAKFCRTADIRRKYKLQVVFIESATSRYFLVLIDFGLHFFMQMTTTLLLNYFGFQFSIKN